MDQNYILAQLAVKGKNRLYVLGCRASRVTLLSQQTRAFNLIWALFAAGRLREGERVCVIGAGVGGLTVAAAAALMRCNVVVYERTDQPLQMQWQNKTRLIHPNIYDWPLERSEISSTDLPCMNWKADKADGVARQLKRRLDAILSTGLIELNCSVNVKDLHSLDGKPIVGFDNGSWSDGFDCLVLAVGFGLERQLPRVRAPLYWENDSLDQPSHGCSAPKRVLVSGVGDGGYVDVLRLTLRDFDHEKFASKVVREPTLAGLKDELLRIETELRLRNDEKSHYLYQQYSRLSLPEDIVGRLGTSRTDTTVFLSGPDRTILRPNTAIINRVAVFALHREGLVRYVPGKIDPENTFFRDGKYHVRYLSHEKEEIFDELVVRHGPRALMREQFPNHWSATPDLTELGDEDRTRSPLFPTDFFPQWEESVDVRASRRSLLIRDAPENSGDAVSVLGDTADNFEEPPSYVSLSHIPPITSPSPEITDAARTRIENLIVQIELDLTTKNIDKAVIGASELDSIVTDHIDVITRKQHLRALKVIFDSLDLERQRATVDELPFDTNKLRGLVERMKNAPRK
jgi:hypothetical protein